MAVKDNKAAESNDEYSRVGISVLSVLFLFLALLLFLSLASHNAGDLAIIEGGRDARIANWIGRFGVYIARFFLYMLGLASYPIALFFLLCAIWAFFPNSFHHRRGFHYASIALILGLAVLLGLWPEYLVGLTQALGIGHSQAPEKALSGGVVGHYLVAPPNPLSPGQGPVGYVRFAIGTVGSAILGSMLVLTAALFIWNYELRLAWRRMRDQLFPPLTEELLRERERLQAEKIEMARRRIEEKRALQAEKEKAKEDKLELRRQQEIERAAKQQAKQDERQRAEAAKVITPVKLSAPVIPGVPSMEPVPASEPVVEPEPVAEPERAPVKLASPIKLSVPVAPPPEPAELRGAELVVESTRGANGAKEAPRGGHGFGDMADYVLPPLKLLNDIKEVTGDPPEVVEEAKKILQDTLNSFGVDAEVAGHQSGPRVTRLEVVLAPGVKVQKVTGLEPNIKMNLQSVSIRILAPIPGRDALGIEVPNKNSSPVSFKNLLDNESWRSNKYEVPVVLGKNVAGQPIVTDLAKAPHLLIAGATGSGKSVCMNTLIMSLIYRFKPSEMRIIMVDPKVVEFEMYKELPHLICPIVNDPKKVPLALRWGINEMERRYRVLAKVKVKNLATFNARPIPQAPVYDEDGKPIPDKLPFIVIIIDELADIMMVSKQEVETSIARIAQKARAVGIHLVLATQRPSVKVITGVIKANLPTRIAFQVTSVMDSRVILDHKGAETLLGRGDMLFLAPGSAKLERIQGAMVADNEIEQVVAFCAAQAEQDFDDTVTSLAESGEDGEERVGEVSKDDEDDREFDEDDGDFDDNYSGEGIASTEAGGPGGSLIDRAVEIVRKERKASTSYLQRRLGIGYNRAADIMDKLERRGVIGTQIGSAPREILIPPED